MDPHRNCALIFRLCVTEFVLLHWLLDKDGELVWEQLTVEEKEEFRKMLSDGRIGHLVDSYTPWWKVSTELYSISLCCVCLE